MPYLVGPEFIAIQIEDLDVTSAFRSDVAGSKVSAHMIGGS